MSGKVISADLERLSNEQIGQRLRDEFNYNPGPILPTTRKTYLKKLQQFVDDSKPKARSSMGAGKQTVAASTVIPSVSKTGASSRSNSASRKRESIVQSKPEVDVPRRSSLGRPSAAAAAAARGGDELSNLSDSELIRRLAEYNFKCGPLNEMTRSVYIKRLRGLIESGPPAEIVVNEKPAASKTKRKSNVSVPNDFVKPVPVQEDYEAVRMSPRLSTGRTTKEPSKKPLQAFSDSESEEPSTSQPVFVNPLEIRRGASLVRKSISNRLSSNTATSSLIPTVSSSRTTITKSNRNNRASDLSESDDQSGGTLIIHNTRKSTSASIPLRPSSLSNFSDSENDAIEIRSKKSVRQNEHADDVNRLLHYRPTRQTVRVARDEEYNQTPVMPKASSIVTQVKRVSNTSNASESYSSRTNKVSIFILFGIVALFAFFGSVYLYKSYFYKVENVEIMELERQFDIKYSELNFPDCSTFASKSNQTDFIPKAYCGDSPATLKPILFIIKELRALVDEQFRQRYCSQDNTNPSKDIYEHDIASLKITLERTIQARVLKQVSFKENTIRVTDGELFSSLFEDALSLLAANAKWHLRPISGSNGYVKLINERLYPTGLDTSCWIKFALLEYWSVVVSFAAALLVFLMRLAWKRSKNWETIHKKEVNDLVNKCLAHLRKEAGTSIPALHIRDTFFSPDDRKKAPKKRLWEDVVRFIENEESRVKVAIENIDGEDFRTWRWVGQTESNESINKITSSVRVSSLRSSTKGSSNTAASNEQLAAPSTIDSSSSWPSSNAAKPFSALTPFLKPRNITLSEVSAEDKIRIKNDILERVALHSDDGKSHGILHLHINSHNPTGCVYMKFDSLESATKAYHALNQWNYEDRIVVVKFMDGDRYYNRFPEAQKANRPLDYD